MSGMFFGCRACFRLISLILLLSVASLHGVGGTYCPGATNCSEVLSSWANDSMVKKVFYCTGSVLYVATVKYQRATQVGPCVGGHSSVSSGCTNPHRHFQYNLGVGTLGPATVLTVNNYWNARFLEGEVCEKVRPADINKGGFAHAFGRTSTGSYSYAIDVDPFYPLHGADDSDYIEIDMSGDPLPGVQVHDLIVYDSGHATVVEGVNAGLPSELGWRFRDSGEYRWYPPSGSEFFTPLNHSMTDFNHDPDALWLEPCNWSPPCDPYAYDPIPFETDHSYSESCDEQGWTWNNTFLWFYPGGVPGHIYRPK